MPTLLGLSGRVWTLAALLTLLPALPPVSTGAAAEATALKVGDLAPNFDFYDTSNRHLARVQLQRDRRPSLVFFWTLRNAPSLKEAAFMNDAQSRYKEQGLAVIGIEAANSSEQGLMENLEKLREIRIEPVYSMVADQDGSLARSFGVKSVPTTFVLNGEGIVTFRMENFSEERKTELLARLEELLVPRQPQPDRKEGSLPVYAPSSSREALRGPAGEAPSITQAESAKRTVQTMKNDEMEKNRYFGDFYFNRQEYDKALAAYLKCLEVDRGNVAVRLKVGEVYVKKRDFPRAREVWEEILRIQPGNKEAEANLRRLIRGEF